MNATRLYINGELKIILVFDDGTHAIHHGMNQWSITRGGDCGAMDTYPYDSMHSPYNDATAAIKHYVLCDSGTLGRIA